MSACPINHVEDSRLETDLMYRFNYVSKFVGFGQEDIDVLHSLAPILGPLVPTVVEAVYEKLFSFDCTKSVFLKRNEGFKGKLDADIDHLSQTSDQIRFRKDMLSKYLVKLVTAEYNESFVKYLDYVGKVHTDKAGSKSINVDYVHCNALFGYVEDYLIAAVLGTNLPAETKGKGIRALNKLLWIQNDLFVRHYLPTAAEKKAIAAASSCGSGSCHWYCSWTNLGMAAAVVGLAAYAFKKA